MSEVAVKKVAAPETVKIYTSDYSKYVALNRSVPALVDGLKPSQRRSINSASDLKLRHDGRFLKASKIEGQITGDYHPHGGVSLAGLIQPFKMRYPLMEGQGNWGCPDNPSSVAASRYVEARLSEFCEDFYLASKEYADVEDNYDGRLKEIVRYYPPIPGVLLTGAEGIAIGFTTRVPTHELGHVCRSLRSYLENPDDPAYLDLLPDTWESSVTITSKEDIRKIYERGTGVIEYKAAVHYESMGRQHLLVVDAFPPSYNRKKLLDSAAILKYVDEGKLSLQNESSVGIRYVFSSENIEVLKEVEGYLTSSITYRLHIEHNGYIRLYTLKQIYDDFIAARKSYVQRMYSSELGKTTNELSYVEALIALKREKNLIRSLVDMDEEEAIIALVQRLQTTEEVVKKILSTPIRSLLKDNMEQLVLKRQQLLEKIRLANFYVANPERKMLEDITALEKKYADGLRTTYGDSGKRESVIYLSEDGQLEVRIEDSLPKDTPPHRFAYANFPYYILYDRTGYVAVEKGKLLERLPGSVFKTENISGILGVKNLKKVVLSFESGKAQPLDDWALRKKISRIEHGNKVIKEFKETP